MKRENFSHSSGGRIISDRLMVLKGRWETGERDEIIHFLLNQTPKDGRVSISLGELRVDMFLRGGNLVALNVNGRPIRKTYEVKGVLLHILERERANFVIADDPYPYEGNFNLPFPALMMEVIALRDHLKAQGVKPERDGGVLQIHGIPRGGDEEEFVRDLRLRYKNHVPTDRLYRDFAHLLPEYLDSMVSRLKAGGYVSTIRSGESRFPIHPLALFFLVIVASAVGGCATVFLIFRVM